MLTVKQVAEKLNCSVSHVYALVDAGELKCHRIGMGKRAGIRVSDGQLQEFLQGSEGTPLPSSPLKLKNLSL